MIAFVPPLLPGILVKRSKRFLADVLLSSEEQVRAHCPNTGAMRDISSPGTRVWVSKNAPSPTRKLDYTWQLVEQNNQLIGANTLLPNRLVKEALSRRFFSEFRAYTSFSCEVPYGENRRVDFFLKNPDSFSCSAPPCYLEVKNVHYKKGQQALFPDSITQRGFHHLNTLALMAQQGFRAVVLYVVQRDDCVSCSLAHEIDAAYAKAACQARDKGVESLAYSCRVSPQGIVLHQPLPFFYP